jgi:hypothetical protein
MPQIFAALAGVCANQGMKLQDAALANKDKITKRLKQGTVKGDGSNRENSKAAPAKTISSTPADEISPASVICQ